MINKILVILAIVLASAAGYGTRHFLDEEIERTHVIAEKDLHLGLNDFVNPLLDCQSPDVRSPKENQMKSEVEAFIAESKSAGRVESISVFYRDLFNGPSFGIDTDIHFTPASLLKVPLMIAYFKEAEKNPHLLEEKLTYDPKNELPGGASQVIGTPIPLIAGKKYDVEFLINRMITVSDNSSAKMLVDRLKNVNISQTLNDMGIQVHNKEGGTWIDVRSYASLMRILYNSTYLSRTYSNAALAMLSRSEYRDGLPAGVDPGVAVAHKFGERTLNKIVQLHDCGIVYFPNRPYLLCVMTRGKSFADLTPTIAKVSNIIYTHVKSGQR